MTTRDEAIRGAAEIYAHWLQGEQAKTQQAFADLIQDFKDTRPELDIWRRYPDISEEEDDLTDTWACESVSERFARYAWRMGWGAKVVHGQPAHPLADTHAWVELHWAGGVINVDWTARQFHDLGVVDGVLDQPWPLVWEQGDHPALGEYKREEGNDDNP